MQTLRSTLIKFILSRYVFSLHLTLVNEHSPTTHGCQSVLVSLHGYRRQHCPRPYCSQPKLLVLHASHDRHNEQRQQRRRRILTWLPRKLQSTFQRTFVAIFRREEISTQQDEPLDFKLDSSWIGRMENSNDETKSSAQAVYQEVLPTSRLRANSCGDEAPPSLPNSSSRSETASPTTDLTGSWQLEVTSDFKQQYDKYLKLLGQSLMVRSVAVSIIRMTSEETRQEDSGRSLWIKGTNPRGVWERVLVSSSLEDDRQYEIQTIDKETVRAEAWWEEDGTKHRSWLKGVSKYGGGSFESLRYLDGPDTLVCESTFHPTDTNRETARVTWRFARTIR